MTWEAEATPSGVDVDGDIEALLRDGIVALLLGGRSGAAKATG